jgi:hypothetical protein
VPQRRSMARRRSDKANRCSDIQDRQLRAMCGRLRVGRANLHVALLAVQLCIRPVSAVHMTVGRNALRGSDPGKKPAFDKAMAHVGCPDRWIDRLCLTYGSPSQLHIAPDAMSGWGEQGWTEFHCIIPRGAAPTPLRRNDLSRRDHQRLNAIRRPAAARARLSTRQL